MFFQFQLYNVVIQHFHTSPCAHPDECPPWSPSPVLPTAPPTREFFIYFEYKSFLQVCVLWSCIYQSWLVFSLNDILQRTDIFYFDDIQISSFFFYKSCFWYLKSLLPHPGPQNFSPLFSRRFIVTTLSIKSVINFELIFVYVTKYELKFTFLHLDI